jgi:hypothetical protein
MSKSLFTVLSLSLASFFLANLPILPLPLSLLLLHLLLYPPLRSTLLSRS